MRDKLLPCGCFKTIGPSGAYWPKECRRGHERPGGHASWKAYISAWRDCQCVVCNRNGFKRGNDFEMVGMNIYAHKSCAEAERKRRNRWA